MKAFLQILGTVVASMPIENGKPFIVFLQENCDFIFIGFPVESLVCDGGVPVEMRCKLSTNTFGQLR